MLLRFACLLSVVACGGGATSTATAPSRPAPSAAYPAPLYAGLFVRGATFRYALATASSRNDPDDPNADAHGNVDEQSTVTMTCTVEDVHPLPAAISATIQCDPDVGVPVGNAGPAGTYVATSAGLWREDSIPPGAGLEPATQTIAANPTERRTTAGGVETHIDQGGGGSWCVSTSWSSGDDGDTSMCFAHGVIVGGSASWAGGSSREATYTLIK